MSRRKNLTALDVIRMKQLESEGKSRSAIAKEIPCHQSCVTRHLGAARSYTKKVKDEAAETPVQ